MSELFGATYLGGWYVPLATPLETSLGLTNVAWFPLPGRILKVGKTTKQLAQMSVYRRREPGDLRPRVRVALSYDERVAVAAYSLAKGIDCPDDYPILGAFRRALLRASTNTLAVANQFTFGKRMDDDPLKGWTSLTTTGGRHLNIDRALTLEMVCDRYDIDIVALLDLESLLDTVTNVPAFVSHPVCERLMRVDYA
jgi:ribosomal protein S30